MSERKSITGRFWAKVNKDGPAPEHVPHLGPCWMWTASGTKDGYGTFYVNGQHVAAHRFSWQLHNGAVPDETPNVLHRCDNPPCVNPEHLFLGTLKDNMRDMYEKGRYRGVASLGTANASAKVDAALVRYIRRRWQEGYSTRVIARDVPVNFQTVHKICKRQLWAHVE